MRPAGRPADEVARLAALRACEVLDTPAEAGYDELAELAAYVCGTPMAAVTLIAEDRQWFKARFAVAAREVPRDLAFCAYTILEPGLHVVPDTLRHAVFADHPMVTGPPHLRCYAGAPLVLDDGQIVGTLAVFDTRPRELEAAQLKALRSLSRQAAALLDARRHAAREARRALQDAVERFELVSRATNDAVWDWDLTTNLLWWNPAFRSLFGYRAEDVEPGIESWTSRLHPEDHDRVKRGIYAVIESRGEAWSDEYRFRRGDGSYADIFDRGYVLYAAGKPVRMIGAMMDVSERRRLEAELRQSQKLDAIGRLSGGIAHDFNNLLTVIQCNATMLGAAGDASETALHTEEILQASERAANLTRRLLLLSRTQVVRLKPVDLNTIVVEMTRMLRRVVGEQIELVARCGKKLPAVHGDAGMLEQVVLNLVVNARDAMPEGGQLTIATGTQASGSETSVWLSVTDTGTGIAPELLPRIFDPFFTTKDIGKGTGLGLATVYGIIQQHRGSIEVTSEPGHGTTFRCTLPSTSDEVASVPVQRPSAMPRGNETLLVVEDEAALGSLITRLLQRCGYEVLRARNGVEALELWGHHKQRIELVFTDVVMPGGISGCDLAKRLRAEAPSLKIVFSSGYSTELDSLGEPLVEGTNFLQKPYQPATLAQTIRARLDE